MSRLAVVRDPLEPSLSVVVEDDDRVAFAYLRRSESIVADVWLYNILPAPVGSRPSVSRGAAPLNPAVFASERLGVRVESPDDVHVEWLRDGDPLFVGVFIGGIWVAAMAEGLIPGWSRFARRTGPLARRLSECPLGLVGGGLARKHHPPR